MRLRGIAPRLSGGFATGEASTSWNRIALEFDRIAADQNAAFDQATVLNGREFLALASMRASIPATIRKGYWSTFSFQWEAFEVEVFGDHVEAYRFDRPGVDVTHFDRAPGEPFPDALLAMLPAP